MTATYLLTWNRAKWPWDDLPQCIETLRRRGSYPDTWGCGVTKKIIPGDRLFLMKLGSEPRGLIGSGWATTNVYARPHWDETARARGRVVLCIDLKFDVLLDPDRDIFPRAWLAHGVYAQMYWEPQASGVTIREAVASQLEEDWARFLNHSVPSNKRYTHHAVGRGN